MQADEEQLQYLKVIILFDEHGWYAQGFEIDHDAEGESLHAVKLNFERSLASLVSNHMSNSGNLDALLKPTPADIWEDLSAEENEVSCTYADFGSREGLRLLPYLGICYFEPVFAAWAAGPKAIGKSGIN